MEINDNILYLYNIHKIHNNEILIVSNINKYLIYLIKKSIIQSLQDETIDITE